MISKPLPRYSSTLCGWFMIFFFNHRIAWNSIGVSHQMCLHGRTGTYSNICTRTWSSAIIGKSNKTPTAFQRKSACTEQQRSKGKKKKRGGVDAGDCTSLWKWPSETKAALSAHPLRREISQYTHPSTHHHQHHQHHPCRKKKRKSFGSSLAARGATLDTYHVHQVLLLGFLFFKTYPPFPSFTPSFAQPKQSIHTSSLAPRFFFLVFFFFLFFLSISFSFYKHKDHIVSASVKVNPFSLAAAQPVVNLSWASSVFQLAPRPLVEQFGCSLGWWI